MSPKSQKALEFEDYSYGMRKAAFGHAFLHPASDFEAYPGVCGFIDESGGWQKIVDVTNPDELRQCGLGPLRLTAYEKKRERTKWGPRTTDTVSRVSITTDAAAQANIPLTFSAAYKYELQGNFGAILV